MIHPDTELRFISPEIGYGVFATRFIPRGTLVWTLCLFDRIFTPQEARAMQPQVRAVLDKYAYIDLDGNHVLCWDAGRYVNHSCDPVMLGLDQGFEIAVRDVQAGEEITCEYGSLNLLHDLTCFCQSAQCRGTISGGDARAHWQAWDAQVPAALAEAGRVPQPLQPFSVNPARFAELVAGRRAVPSFEAHYDALPA